MTKRWTVEIHACVTAVMVISKGIKNANISFEEKPIERLPTFLNPGLN